MNPIPINYGVLSFRALLRDFYAKTYSRGFSIDRMAMGDFDTGSNIIGRIELVEEITLGLREIAPKHFEFTLEETHYAEWLSKAFNPELVTFFFYGVT